MNKTQRKTIVSLAAEIQTAVEDGMPLPELKTVVNTVKTQLESIRDEEQEKLENMPESLQSSSKGEALQEGIDQLEDIINNLESIDNCEDGDEEAVGETLETATGNMEAMG